MIRFANVTKNYPNGHQALNNISFTLKQGEMAFLTGHSGAGKTTLLKLMMMIEAITRGQIYINNRNLSRLSKRQIPYLRRRIGMIFQNPQLLYHRTVFDNVGIPLVISGYRHSEIKRRVRAALDKVGLLKKEKLYPFSLSTGEQQRIGIARAIVNKPMLVIADEPTGNLDPELSSEIMRLFEAFNAVGVTVLIATHDLSLIAPLNYRIITLKEGRLVE
ncbi:cell division ATP-binding protein FtsE [Coxiella burnetii]|uniref:Cell division ATP-binding protein FtsE n=2 Tax=Coxiella burnetii TaxID=777 RepID=Q83AI2_COXBU|nr:cell division ATP-binding protein FtsE [Coxiella burnetii]NP_820881.1 cell division ATP-binding protein [Coxiella burnetii RSA 493]AAO91395.1 cell division ATP-binding protein [Coxiella burnetii RSA 493]ABS78247.1 cell division ATP-binding protein [Coxiella burnetii Dugway 5J108-111]ABX78940.1 cell division ABC transporter, ATP-binding protein FtsE [Coxiella burnetii RSA 331]ACJ17473.1 cell division ATP-binding protein [Coxiella burnetii CbuG_Q212]ACJ19341.1 cell division ATP-binding prote